MVLAPNQSPDAVAGADGRVLIGQFTTDEVVNLTMNFQWDDEASNTFNAEGYSIMFPEVPGPGCTNPNAGQLQRPCQRRRRVLHVWWRIEHRLVLRRGVFDPLVREDTYRIYANFSSNDVEVTAVYGTDTEPWFLDGDAPFYQDALGGDFGGFHQPIVLRLVPYVGLRHLVDHWSPAW